MSTIGAHRRPAYEPGELIVKLKNTAPSSQPQVDEQYGARIVERFDFGHQLSGDSGDLVRMKLPPGLPVEKAVKLFSQNSQVEYAEPNLRYYPDALPPNSPAPGPEGNSDPNDLNYRLWGLENTGRDFGKRGADISAKEAWKITVGDRKNGPIVAIIDTGVDVTHPDLIDNLWVNQAEIPDDGIDNDGNGVVDDIHGYNAFHDNNDLSDIMVHGTHVAGTVGAVGNNGVGITGVAQEARLMTVRIFGESGHTNEATVLRGLSYADRMGARITTNSWGGVHSQAMEEAFRSSPALHLASAGNSGKNNDAEPHFPGSYTMDNMVAVAATDNKDKLGSFSCYGAESVDLAAPGQNIYSTMPGHRYKKFSGTSMATPHATGVASLILTEYPNASNAEVKARLLYGTDPLEELLSKTTSGGRLNAASSLEHDTLAPSAFPEFRASATAREIVLRWTETGDDGNQGIARKVDLRANSSEISEESFEQASPLLAPKPKTAGSSQIYRQSLSLCKDERQVHFAIRASDNIGQHSPLSVTSATVPAAKVCFEDKPELQNKWFTTGTWAKVDLPDSPQAWSDSPDRDYEYGENSSLTSPRISLAGSTGSVLRFESKFELERGDYLRLQVSTDGDKWKTKELYRGKSDWRPEELSLSEYDGQDIQVRFALETDAFTNGDGVRLKGIEILGEGSQSSLK